MASKIPEKIINARVFIDGNKVQGTGDIELPSFEAMSDSISGAGIAGEIETPLIGHFGSQTTSITFRLLTEDALKMLAPKRYSIEARSANQMYDQASGEYKVDAYRVVMRGRPKSVEGGTMNVAVTTDSPLVFELEYISIYYNDTQILEFDKFNFKYVVDGTDYLAEVRTALGE